VPQGVKVGEKGCYFEVVFFENEGDPENEPLNVAQGVPLRGLAYGEVEEEAEAAAEKVGGRRSRCPKLRRCGKRRRRRRWRVRRSSRSAPAWATAPR
jgi:hypothetical protein